MSKLAFCIFCMVFAVHGGVLIPVAVSQDPAQQAEAITAYVLDCSGSMKQHGFAEAKEALIEKVKRIRRREVNYIIPFAENERQVLRVVYEDILPPRLQAVESFIRELTADGQYTNFDEGIDTAKLSLMREPGDASHNIMLLTDGISDPGPHHNEIKLDDLASRVPSGLFSFYIIDLANNEYPGLSTTTIGNFSGYSQPGSSLVVIPLQDAVRLGELFTELDKKAEKSPPVVDGISEQLPEKQEFPVWRSSYLVPLILLALILAVLLILRLRKSANLGPILFEGAEVDTEDNDAEQKNKTRTVCIKVGGTERRFGIPVMLTVGSRKKDNFTVKDARRCELTVLVSEDKQFFRHRKGIIRKDRGSIFRSRSFSLRDGTPVRIDMQSDGQTLHRSLV